MALLSACRSQLEEQQLQGISLGTGYHITLYADLGDSDRAVLETGIQGELAQLERQRSVLLRHVNTAFSGPGLPLSRLSGAVLGELDRLIHALAVDRLTAWLAELGIDHSLVEVGGVIRAQGMPPGAAWRLSLEHAGLPKHDDSRRVHLKDGALVHRLANHANAPSADGPKMLGVTVMAATASEASRQALWLSRVEPDVAMAVATSTDSAVRIVVRSRQGIEIQNTAALESWLEP
ncbi:FAD:protein FMN transferase [Billgrantia endophytica]|nr:FAD:protein FMN transferase [Halomonas endophytica]